MSLTYKSKKIISFIISVICAIVLVKVFFAILGVLFFAAITIAKVILILFLVAFLALPLYLVINRKLFN